MRVRRAGAVVALAVLLTVAGCTQLLLEQETSYVAEEANVTNASAVGFTHNTSDWQNVSRSVEAADQEREVTVSNRETSYLNRSADGTPGAAFIVLSSPQVQLAGQELSPVAEWSQRDILNEFSGQFDQYGNLTEIEERETREVTVVGKEADLRVFNATMQTGEEENDDVVVTVAKVEDEGDYVIVIGIRGMNEAKPGATDGAIEAMVRKVEH
jgi:hypothetical protein